MFCPLTSDQQRNILRQLTDLQASADRLDNAEDFETAVVQFNRFSQEMKHYLQLNSHNPMVLDRAERIIEVEYDAPTWNPLYYIFLPAWAAYIARDYAARASCKEKIREIASIYSSIHFLLKAEWS